MPTYQCSFLGENNKTVRTEVLRAFDDLDARREARILMARVGRFSGYELRSEGRQVEVYRSVKESKSARKSVTI
jgi:hypothetical protein